MLLVKLTHSRRPCDLELPHRVAQLELAIEEMETEGAKSEVLTGVVEPEKPVSRSVRQARAGPLLAEMEVWFREKLRKLSAKSGMAEAIRYALTRYCADGRVEIDNNATERALRVVALGRKTFLFAGTDRGGESAALIYSLLGAARFNGIDPSAYLRAVLERINAHAINSIDELLAWNLAEKLAAPGTAEA